MHQSSPSLNQAARTKRKIGNMILPCLPRPFSASFYSFWGHNGTKIVWHRITFSEHVDELGENNGFWNRKTQTHGFESNWTIKSTCSTNNPCSVTELTNVRIKMGGKKHHWNILNFEEPHIFVIFCSKIKYMVWQGFWEEYKLCHNGKCVYE